MLVSPFITPSTNALALDCTSHSDKERTPAGKDRVVAPPQVLVVPRIPQVLAERPLGTQEPEALPLPPPQVLVPWQLGTPPQLLEAPLGSVQAVI